MKKKSLLKITLFFKFIKVLILAFVFIPQSFSKDKFSKNKKEIIGSIERQKDRLIEISDKIWEAAETSLQEFKSSKYLSDYAWNNRFKSLSILFFRLSIMSFFFILLIFLCSILNSFTASIFSFIFFILQILFHI